MDTFFSNIGSKKLIIILLLVASTLVVYQPIKDNDFINFDDDMYVTDNSQVQNGLSWHNVIWAFKSFEASNYHPVTWLSHMLDCQLYGLNSTGHHFMSLSFHLINVALLFLVLQSMTGAVWRSAFVASLFALHPINVESVAWIAERKNVLSTMFWLLTMWSYVYFARRRSLTRYFLVITCFLLGILAKPMLVTLPFVLLLLDYWPLNRFHQTTYPLSVDTGTDSFEEKKPNKSFTNTLLPLVVEKIPLFIISIGISILTVVAQRDSGAIKSTAQVDVKGRILNTAVSYIDYIYLMFWPKELSIFYPHPGSDIPYKKIILAFVLLMGISLIAIIFAKNHRYILVGWLWFVGTLVPVIGLVQVGGQAMADRYAYIPLVGLFIIIAWGAYDLFHQRNFARLGFPIAGFCVLATLSFFAHRQVGYWVTSLSLFEHAIRVNPNNYVAYNNTGVAYSGVGLIDKAFENYQMAAKIKPTFTEARFNLGLAYAIKGEEREAIEHFCTVLNYSNSRKILAKTHNNVGAIMFKQNNYEEAQLHFVEAIRLQPDFIDPYNNLGVLLYTQGKHDEAAIQFSNVLKIGPNPLANYRLGKIQQDQGNYLEATRYYQEALKIAPDFKLVQEELDVTLAKINESKPAGQ